MRKGGSKPLKLAGTRILSGEADADALAREFMDNSWNPSQYYTKVGDMTTAFTTGAKKPRPVEDGPTMDDYYSDEGEHEFSENDFLREMDKLGVDPSQQGYGCNHSMICETGCRFYHDTNTPRRKHYHQEEGTTAYVKSRYGRFVREYGSVNMIRLNDDPMEDAQAYPRDSLYEEGWHHEPTCTVNCKRYHYPGSLPDRYARLSSGVFHETPNGRWVRELINGDMAYVRIGPNEDTKEPGDLASTSLSLMNEAMNKSKTPKNTVQQKSFRDMTEAQLISYFKSDVKSQDMCINELTRILLPLQRPVEEDDTTMVEVLLSGASPEDKNKIMASLKRLLDMHEEGLHKHSCVTYSLKDKEMGRKQLAESVTNALLDIREKERDLPEIIEQSLILLICVNDISKKTVHLMERLKATINEDVALPDDVYVFIFGVADFGASVLDPRNHRTLQSAVDAITQDINSGDEMDPMYELGTIIPCFPVITTMTSKQRNQLISRVLDSCRSETYCVGGLVVGIEDNDFVKLIDYHVTPSVLLGEEKKMITLVNQEMEGCFAVFDEYYNELFEKHPLFREEAFRKDSRHPTASFGLLQIEKSTAEMHSRYPGLANTLRNPEYASFISLCIENQTPVPYIFLEHKDHFIQHIHIITPVNTGNIKRKRKEIEPKIKENNNKKRKVVNHEWKDDPTLSNRKTVVSVCVCSLEDHKHYQRPCSSGVNCLGNGFKSGIPRGYCSRACQHQKK